MDDVVDVAIDEFISLNSNTIKLGSVCGGKYLKVVVCVDETEAEGLVVAENGRSDVNMIVNNDLRTPNSHP